MARASFQIGTNFCVLLLLAALLTAAGSPAIAAQLSPGDLLVADQDSGAIHQYDAHGVYQGAFAGGLIAPEAITVDRNGNVYVSEYAGQRVDKFSPSGVLIWSISLPYLPGNVEVGSDGLIYVANYFGGDVYRYSSTGAALGLFASTGLLRADFMAFDASSNLYVTDFFSGSIRRISPTRRRLGKLRDGTRGRHGHRVR